MFSFITCPSFQQGAIFECRLNAVPANIFCVYIMMHISPVGAPGDKVRQLSAVPNYSDFWQNTVWAVNVPCMTVLPQGIILIWGVKSDLKSVIIKFPSLILKVPSIQSIIFWRSDCWLAETFKGNAIWQYFFLSFTLLILSSDACLPPVFCISFNFFTSQQQRVDTNLC